MTGTFACPECGARVEPAGLAPGRHARCSGCQTLVEVPFLPRMPTHRPRTRAPRRHRVSTWFLGGLALVVLIAGMARWALSRRREAREGQVLGLIASSRAAEAAGRPGQALVDAEAALTLARDRRIGPLERLDDLRRRRDQLSRRDVEARLDAASRLDRDLAIGECLTLQARASADPALADLDGRIGSTLADLALADLADARDDLEAGRSEQALTRCERVLTATARRPMGHGPRARDEARSLASAVIDRFGVAIEPVRGRFTLGSARAYDEALRPILTEALRDRHYLPRPASSPFRSGWDQRAGSRLAIEITEAQDRPYLGSAQRATEIDGRLTLSRAGEPTWETRLTARTRPSVPGLTTYGASRIILGSRRSDPIERRLYEDAWSHLLDLIVLKLQTLPEPGNGGRSEYRQL